jgi:hypothetical protein
MYPPRHPHRQAQGQIAERALLEKIKIRDRSNIALELRPTSPEIGKQSKGDTQVERKRATDFPQGLLDLFDHYVTVKSADANSWMARPNSPQAA